MLSSTSGGRDDTVASFSRPARGMLQEWGSGFSRECRDLLRPAGGVAMPFPSGWVKALQACSRPWLYFYVIFRGPGRQRAKSSGSLFYAHATFRNLKASSLAFMRVMHVRMTRRRLHDQHNRGTCDTNRPTRSLASSTPFDRHPVTTPLSSSDKTSPTPHASGLSLQTQNSTCCSAGTGSGTNPSSLPRFANPGRQGPRVR